MSMNIFRLAGDTSHAISILWLLWYAQKDGRGLSLRSQELYLLVFLTRYLDLLTTFYSLYNSIMKMFYIASTAFLVFRIQKAGEDGSSRYDQGRDVFPHVLYLVLPSVLLATIVHLEGSGLRNFDLLELLWTFSICLEAVAIIPQLVLLQKYRKIKHSLANAVLSMSLYRYFYILNWIYRAYTEKGYQHHWLVYTTGVAQTFMYADFFYSYMVHCVARASTNSSSQDLEERQDPTQREDQELTYNPILQNRLCCCSHVANDEEGNSGPDGLLGDSTSDESQQSGDTITPTSAPPILLFSRPCLLLWLVATISLLPGILLGRGGPESGPDPAGICLLWVVVVSLAWLVIKGAYTVIRGNRCPSYWSGKPRAAGVSLALFEEKIQEVESEVLRMPEDPLVRGKESDLQKPLLHLEEGLVPSSGNYVGEHKQTTIVEKVTTEESKSKCSLWFQFVWHEGGWAIAEEGSAGSLMDNGSKDHGDEESPHEKQFTIPKGYISTKTGKCYWVEKDLDPEVTRVFLGEFDFETNSIQAEWQSSAGSQGTRVLSLTRGEENGVALCEEEEGRAM